MKNVTFYNELRPVKTIVCDLVDILPERQTVTFYGVQCKDGKRNIMLEHKGKFYYELNQREKTCFIDFSNNRTALVTW